MDLQRCVAMLGLLVASATQAAPAAGDAKSFDAAAAFGARPGVADLSLSPDGRSVAYIVPTKGQGSMLVALDLAEGSKPHIALTASGKPERLGNCHWVSLEEHRDWSDFYLVSDMIGDGPQVREGSPARNAEKIKVPVLLFHAALDRNVGIAQSRLMAERLAAAGVKHELVTWDDLDHQLEDSAARTEMLRKSDVFLRQAIGVVP